MAALTVCVLLDDDAREGAKVTLAEAKRQKRAMGGPALRPGPVRVPTTVALTPATPTEAAVRSRQSAEPLTNSVSRVPPPSEREGEGEVEVEGSRGVAAGERQRVVPSAQKVATRPERAIERGKYTPPLAVSQPKEDGKGERYCDSRESGGRSPANQSLMS